MRKHWRDVEEENEKRSESEMSEGKMTWKNDSRESLRRVGEKGKTDGGSQRDVRRL